MDNRFKTRGMLLQNLIRAINICHDHACENYLHNPYLNWTDSVATPRCGSVCGEFVFSKYIYCRLVLTPLENG